MSDASRPSIPHAKPHAFEIKGADLPLVALLLKTTNLQRLADEWQQQYGANPNFFDNEPLVIDLTPLALVDADDSVPDFQKLMVFLRSQRTWPVAVKGGNAAQMAAALAMGLVPAPEAVLHRHIAGQESAPATLATPASASTPTVQPPASATGADRSPMPQVTVTPPEVPLSALVIDKPLRSGQQVYARGRDLVVMAMVNPGAEVIADGHIHVYAPLRGKAIAGARGNGDARIFALSLEAELISIAGIYRTSDVPLPDSVKGRPAMVSLQPSPDGDKLVVSPIHH